MFDMMSLATAIAFPSLDSTRMADITPEESRDGNKAKRGKR